MICGGALFSRFGKWNKEKLEDLSEAEYREVLEWSMDVRKRVRYSWSEWSHRNRSERKSAYRALVGDKYDEGDFILPDYEDRHMAYWKTNWTDTPLLNTFE